MEWLGNKTVYECSACGWEGEKPSISDLSEMEDEVKRTFRHIVICPRCCQQQFIKPVTAFRNA